MQRSRFLSIYIQQQGQSYFSATKKWGAQSDLTSPDKRGTEVYNSARDIKDSASYENYDGHISRESEDFDAGSSATGENEESLDDEFVNTNDILTLENSSQDIQDMKSSSDASELDSEKGADIDYIIPQQEDFFQV